MPEIARLVIESQHRHDRLLAARTLPRPKHVAHALAASAIIRATAAANGRRRYKPTLAASCGFSSVLAGKRLLLARDRCRVSGSAPGVPPAR